MNVLFIGNSYIFFNDLDKLFESLCRENGHDVTAFRITKGARKMIHYMDPEDPTTLQLEAMVRERHYHICILQEQSLLPLLDYDTFLAGMTHVKRMVGTQADRFMLYATWARKLGSPDLETYGWTREEMTEGLHKAYCQVGNALDMPVVPVGKCFWQVVCNHPELELYKSDLFHPSYLGSCLAALTHYYTIFGEFPRNTASLQLSDDILTAFCQAVCRN